ncbi:hypothetical protein EX30DRAFT_396207 [Ascodesmis nigricans]|uniref:Autophagy-related protein 14 n=1 Tax=Ascodesmis nigricans TaxID=341454 RepID=A0A4S2MV91_9PEZI|nr:hypothetical protein EX30DRAFT_396207 [Ascodesmis nigricans]
MPADSDNPSCSSFLDTNFRPRDRPSLLPYNRRLRHLSSICLRNLTTSPPASEPTPTPPANVSDNGDAANDPGPRRPTRRRRSTKSFPGPPVMRKRWDVFFSLHSDGVKEPLYISEVVEKSMNPDFQAFDLSEWGPAVTRLEKLTVKVWCHLESGWTLLLEAEVELSELTFLGRNMENFRYPLAQNAVIFGLSDGFYTAFWDYTRPPPPLPPRIKKLPTTITASYDTLHRLTNLTTCLYDAQTTTHSLTTQISTTLTSTPTVSLPSLVSTQRAKLETLRSTLTAEQKRLATLHRRLKTLQTSLLTRRAALETSRLTISTTTSHLHSALPSLTRCTTALSSTREAISSQRRTLIKQLFTIFPIRGLPDDPLTYSILSLPLPTPLTEPVSSASAISTSAALGYVAQLVYMLSFYLSVPLRYPVQPLGSTSYITDSVSVIQGPRVFPLWCRNTVWYRVEYAVFLLNKDIEQLLARVGIGCADVRMTLGNLLLLGAVVGEGGGGGVLKVEPPPPQPQPVIVEDDSVRVNGIHEERVNGANGMKMKREGEEMTNSKAKGKGKAREVHVEVRPDLVIAETAAVAR